jgi:hypothetical protein
MSSRAASSANLTEQELNELESIDLDLGGGLAAPPPSTGAAPGFGPPAFAPSAPAPFAPYAPAAPSHGALAPQPDPNLPDPFALAPEPYAAPEARQPKPSVHDLANRVADAGVRAAAHFSPMLEDARAKTGATTARAVKEAKSRGLVPLAAILVAVGVLVAVLFVVVRFVIPESGASPASSEPRTKHVAESAGAIQK